MDGYEHIDARPITGNVGAEISGLDLRQLDPDAEVDLRQALIDRKILLIRDHEMTPHQYADFMRLFGTPVKEDMQVDGGHPPEVSLQPLS